MEKPSINEKAVCACGAVTVTVKGRVRAMMLCACRDCRKASGTGHATITGFARPDITIEGEVKGFARIANSGSEITRHFCPECGTPIYATTMRAPDFILIPTGLFDSPEWFAPTQIIFARTHMSWDTLPPDIPHFETYRNEER